MKTFGIVLAIASVIPSINGLAIEKRGTSIRTGWNNQFWDDFKGTVGSLPNEANWIIDTGTQYPGGPARWGNNEAQTYTRNKLNLEIIDGGYLKITPRLDSGKWTSGRVQSVRKDFRCIKGGKMLIESRIRMGDNPASKQQGIWPAFWALGGEFRGNYQNWPKVTEWDFAELVNGQNNLYNTIHCGTPQGGPCKETNGLGSGGALASYSRAVYHVVGFEIDRKDKKVWRDETIKWFLDGKLVWTLKGNTVNDYDAWIRIVDKGHFLLFNVAVGGNWPGQPNAQTLAGPKSGMIVDWVGVWTN